MNDTKEWTKIYLLIFKHKIHWKMENTCHIVENNFFYESPCFRQKRSQYFPIGLYFKVNDKNTYFGREG